MHTLTLVLVPEQKEYPLDQVEELLRPHAQPPDEVHENVKCLCVGREASKHGTQVANREVGTDNELRERYREERLRLSRQERASFQSYEDYRRPWDDARGRAARAHPNWGVVDPNCADCGGSGLMTFEGCWIGGGKFDWYTMGGRFTGALDPDYDPVKDPQNYGTCWACKGEGTDRLDPSRQCGCCKGKGEAVKSPYFWEPFEGDIKPVSELLDLPLWTSQAPKAQFSDFTSQSMPIHRPANHVPVPGAVLTPDGRWHEADPWDDSEQEAEAWAQEALELLQCHPDTMAVVMDCHGF